MDLRLLPAAAITWLAAWWLTRPLPITHAQSTFIGLLTISMIVLIALSLKREPLVSAAPASRPSSFCGPQSGRAESREVMSILQAITCHLTLAIAGVLAVTMAVSNYQTRAADFLANVPQTGTITVTGKVISEPRKAPFGNDYVWILQESKTKTQIQVTGAQLPYYAIGQITGTTKPTEPTEKTMLKLTATQVTLVKQPKPWWRVTNSLRKDLMEVTASLSPQGRGLVPGMAIGDTSRMPPELKSAFKVSGLAHLTAVSGGHFAVILIALSYVTGALRLSKWARITLFAIIATGFVMLVRPDPAVVRAAAMCAVSIVATTRGRRALAIPALGTSILVLLAVDPWLARSYGFALSCAASGALASFATPFARKLTPWLGEWLAYLVAVPAVAQAACAPILLLFTDGAATTTVLANLLVGPAVAPATLLSLAATLLAPLWPWSATMVARCASWATAWIAWVATRCASLPFALLPIPGGVVGALSLAGATALLGVAIWRWQPRGWPDSWRQFAKSQRQRTRLRTKAGLRRFQLGIPNRTDQRLAWGGYLMALVLLFVLSTGATKLITSRNSLIPTDWQIAACEIITLSLIQDYASGLNP